MDSFCKIYRTRCGSSVQWLLLFMRVIRELDKKNKKNYLSKLDIQSIFSSSCRTFLTFSAIGTESGVVKRFIWLYDTVHKNHYILFYTPHQPCIVLEKVHLSKLYGSICSTYPDNTSRFYVIKNAYFAPR